MGAQYSTTHSTTRQYYNQSLLSTTTAASCETLTNNNHTKTNNNIMDVSEGANDENNSDKLQHANRTSYLSPMPQLQRPETFEEKLYRKFKAEPLVPIGCLTTAYFLGSGIRSFYDRNPAKSQTMMRLRVASQFATILVFIGYAGMNSFTLQFAPGMAVPSEQGFGVGTAGSSDAASAAAASGQQKGESE